jgi:hypothetical protein
MLSESSRIQLLKNTTEEREAMLAQAAIHVPKGEVRKRAQITYLVAKVSPIRIATCQTMVWFIDESIDFAGTIG